MRSSFSIGTSALTTLMLSVAAAHADTFIEPFDAGPAHVGAWTYGLPVTYPGSGGNPGRYQRTTGIDTFAPQPRTTLGVESIFTGDYRAAGVTSVGIDLNTFAVDFSAAKRPLTVMLISDNNTPGNFDDDWAAYHVGKEDVPVPGQGWKSFDFDIPSQSTTLPPGWVIQLFGPQSPDDPDWNDVITDVDQLRYFYGDPDFFFIFQMWTLGLDNARITTAPKIGPGDVNGDGNVDVDDLLEVINAWGDCPDLPAPPPCPADLDGDGDVDVDDLLEVINNWT